MSDSSRLYAQCGDRYRTSTEGLWTLWNRGYEDIQENAMNRSSVGAMNVVTRRIFSQTREGILVLFLGWLAATGRREI
jgi:hypothetical protein